MSNIASGPRRFLALVFPYLAADLCRLTMGQTRPDGASPADTARALVFTVKQRGAFRLHALDARALALGLEPGMALADARARVPDLIDLPHDPEGETALLARLATQAERFTPMVAIDPPEALVLDIAGCAHLFGSEDDLAHDAARFMAAQGLRVAHACADTPEAALALARFGEQGDAGQANLVPLPQAGGVRGGQSSLAPRPLALKGSAERRPETKGRPIRDTHPRIKSHVPLDAPAHGRAGEQAAIRALPLIALRIEPEKLTSLRRAGFATIGDLATLPRGPLAARFGAALVDALDRLLGRVDSRIVPRRRPPRLFADRRFAEPIARIETVMAALGDLLAQLGERLAERHEGGRHFALRLFRSDGATRDLAVETGAPVRDPALVLRLFAERIEALADPLDPGFGFDMLRLAIARTEALAAEQAALTGERNHAQALATLLDRLGARLGADRFCRIVPHESHVPERAMAYRPAAALRDGAAAPWTAPPPGEPPLRPLTLLDPPERIEVIAQVPDGPPRQFRWRRTAHRIVAQEGPERIAPEWWRRQDGHDANPGLSRDYYRVEDEAGQRFWLFRHGLYERETDAPHWYVHGLFA